MVVSNSNATSSHPGASPVPPRQPSTKPLNRVIPGPHGRILCIADIRGQISHLNTLAAETGACAIIHTGDFGYFEPSSLDRVNDRTLRHLLLYTPLLSQEERNRILGTDNPSPAIRAAVTSSPSFPLSEFPLLLSGKLKLDVPVYTVWGACEDVAVVEKLRANEYEIDNLYLLDEATTRTIDVGGVKFRLLGLGGALVPHKMFDNGDGQATIAGGQGTMWTTALQIGELVDTAQRHYDTSETRLLVTHASPGREALLAQLAHVLKADLTVSAGLHFRYASSYNEFSVHGDPEGYRAKLLAGKESFDRVWESVRAQVEAVIDDNQRLLLEKTILVSQRIPPPATTGTDDPAWKNCWNWNLCDAAYGYLALDIKDGRVSAELKSQGFNFAYRRAPPSASTVNASTPAVVARPLPSTQPSSAPSPTPTSSAVPIGPPAGLPRPIANEPPSQAINGLGHDDLAQHHPPPVNGTSSREPASGPSESPGNGQNRLKKTWRKDRERSESMDSKASPIVGAKSLSGSHSKSGSKGSTQSPNLRPEATLEGAAKPGLDSEPLSPSVTGDRSSGARTPNSKRPPRHPWTLYVNRLPLPVTEVEIREFFGDRKEDITFVKLPRHPQTGQQKPVAFVEFKDEATMQAGLTNHAEKIRDSIIRVAIAENRDEGGVTSDGADGVQGPGGRGRGGYRGKGRGAGILAHRALGQATAAATGQSMPAGRGKRMGEALGGGSTPDDGPKPKGRDSRRSSNADAT